MVVTEKNNFFIMVLHKKFLKLYELMESKTGHYFIGFIVVINAIALGVQTFQNTPSYILEILHHIDKVILGVFVVELVIKLLAGGFSFFHSGWNIFDLIIIGGSLIHQHDFLPVLRVIRVMHLMAMMDAAPKIRHILGGFLKAIPGVASVLCLLLLFFYIFSVLGVFIFRDLGAPEFQHIGISMKTMFQVLTGDDWANVMRSIEKVAKYAWVYFISFYILMVFIILNLFIGVVVGALQAAEEEVFNKDDDSEQLLLLKNLQKQINRLEKKLEKEK